MDQKIPDVVRTRVGLHLAEADHRVAQLELSLAGRGITTAVARRLRAARDTARQEAAAWSAILDHIAPRCPVCGLIFEACTCTGAGQP